MVLPLGNAVTAVNTMETGPPVCLFPTASAVVSEREVAMFICPPIAAAAAPAEAKSRVVATVIPLETPGWGGPVVNVLAPKVKVIAEAVVASPPITTEIVPKSLDGFEYVKPVGVPTVVAMAASKTVFSVNLVTVEPDPVTADTL